MTKHLLAVTPHKVIDGDGLFYHSDHPSPSSSSPCRLPPGKHLIVFVSQVLAIEALKLLFCEDGAVYAAFSLIAATMHLIPCATSHTDHYSCIHILFLLKKGIRRVVPPYSLLSPVPPLALILRPSRSAFRLPVVRHSIRCPPR